MKQEKNQLLNEFEKEIWLYLDNALSSERIKYWDEKLNEIPELNKFMQDYQIISDKYNSNEFHLSDEKFNIVIDNAIKGNFIKSKILNYFENLLSTKSEFTFGKIAFASLLVIGAIIISIISNKPSPVINIVGTINSELLDWDAELVDTQISKISKLLKVAQDDDYRKFYKYNITSNNLDKKLNLINTNIENLKKELNRINL